MLWNGADQGIGMLSFLVNGIPNIYSALTLLAGILRHSREFPDRFGSLVVIALFFSSFYFCATAWRLIEAVSLLYDDWKNMYPPLKMSGVRKPILHGRDIGHEL